LVIQFQFWIFSFPFDTLLFSVSSVDRRLQRLRESRDAPGAGDVRSRREIYEGEVVSSTTSRARAHGSPERRPGAAAAASVQRDEESEEEEDEDEIDKRRERLREAARRQQQQRSQEEPDELLKNMKEEEEEEEESSEYETDSEEEEQFPTRMMAKPVFIPK